MARFWKILGLAIVAGAGLAASVAVGSAATGATTSTSTTTVAPPANTSLPAISGTARDGSLLTASNGRWTGSPTSYAYRWQRCDSAGGSCAAIAGANSKQYTVSSADVGHRLRVEVTASNAGGSGTATSKPTGVVASSGNAPSNTRLPSVSGTPQQGATLKVNDGTWTGTAPIRFDYTWQRCDANGNNCSTFIAHAGTTSYTLGSIDVGHRIRVEVQATNSVGSSYVYSAPTAVVAPPKSTQSATTVAVKDVSLPDRLVIDQVHFTPNPVMSRNSEIQARFHVSDTKGLSVQGALVFALGLPYGWTYNAPEQATDANGWVTLVIRPTRNMPLRRGDLVMFVRARKPGDSLLAGVSTRRLVQVGIG
ncbi:MAG TPA: hypothetical protein VKC62_01335 [Gaiellaceae bacterium]|nr:hypothetical protein [Gaiellaceae bacterium]